MEGKWIFRYGDFERHHGAKYLLAREERGSKYASFFEIPNTARSVMFRRHYDLKKSETVCVKAEGDFIFSVNERNYKKAESFTVPAGSADIRIYVGNLNSLCAVKVSGETIYSDSSWQVDCYCEKLEAVGTSDLLESYDGLPGDYDFPKKRVYPISDKTQNGERIIDFGKESFVSIVLSKLSKAKKTDIFYGESIEETYHDRCVIVDCAQGGGKKEFCARACRYIRFTGYTDFEIKAFYPKGVSSDVSKFSGDSELKKIYDIAKYTLELNSRFCYLDGIKRDRWPWCGDAYVTAKMGLYSFFDTDAIRRTLLILRGNFDVHWPLNGILEFSFYWFMMQNEYFHYTGDKEFVERNYESSKELISYYLNNLDDNGFVKHIDRTWLFIDWHDICKEGANCVVQMLYYNALCCMARFSKLCEKEDDYKFFSKLSSEMKKKINKYFWNEEKGAFVSAYYDGKQIPEIRRHQNYFAVLFDIANKKQSEKIIKNVVLNDRVLKITTPFFRFFEYDVLFKCGYHAQAVEGIKKYWGDMIHLGATAVWEEFDENMSGIEHYAMYGEPFDKSLCHAWGAGPLYFIGRYIAGVVPTQAGYASFEVAPLLCYGDFDATVPVNSGKVRIILSKDKICALSDIEGGVLIVKNKKYAIPKNKKITVRL